MFTREQFEKLKNDICDVVDKDYDNVLGILQRFYSVNALNELLEGEDIHEEYEALMVRFLDEMYSEDQFKNYFGPCIKDVEEKARTPIFTIAMMDSMFPEFVNGDFTPMELNDERREMAAIIFENSTVYPFSTDNFKSQFRSIVTRPVERVIPTKEAKVLQIDESR